MKFIWDESDLRLLEVVKGEKIIIFGSGWLASETYDKYLDSDEIKISYVVDNSSLKHGGCFKGLEIFPVEKLQDEDRENTIILIFVTACVEATIQLNEMGFRKFYYADYVSQISSQDFSFNRKGLKNHIAASKEDVDVYKSLKDELKEYYETEINYELEKRRKYKSFITSVAKYFKSSQFNALRIEESELNVFSQAGEDGVIQWVLNRINVKNKRFIEFGAGNYVMANTRFLCLSEGYTGLLIEGSEKRFRYIETDPQIKIQLVWGGGYKL